MVTGVGLTHFAYILAARKPSIWRVNLRDVSYTS